MRGAVGRGQQREVVEGQRPTRSGRLDERDLVHPPFAELVEQQPVVGAVAAAVVGQHFPRVPLPLGVGAEGEHEHVVRNLVAVPSDHAVAVGLDAVQRRLVPAGAELGGGFLQPEAADSLGFERLIDAHRQVDELELGREDGDVEQIGGQRMQRQQRLEAGDPSAGDQHASPAWIG